VKKLDFIILIFFLFCFACEPEDEYSEIPAVKYKNFNFEIENINGFINQVGFLSFDFIDGNGDIGFYENSDTAYDVFVYGFTKVNGSFILTDTTNALLPYFEEGVYKKYLKGEMKIRIYLASDQANDTVRYDFQIMDRAYNLSNLESTPELIIPESY
jgi:hypothetical protein